MWYFSASKIGFYNSDDKDLYISAGSWPDDLVELTDGEYQSLRNDLSDGKILKSDALGNPVTYIPEPTIEQNKASIDVEISAFLALATEKINPLQDAVELGIATEAETAALTAWKTFRILVNRVTSQQGYPTTIDWPAMPE